MIALLKQFAPLILYVVAFVVFVMSMAGNNKWALMFIIALLPLRNIIEKLHDYPFGNDFVDIMLVVTVLGWFISSFRDRHKIVNPSPINGISIIMMFYLLFSVTQGDGYLESVGFDGFFDQRIQIWKNFCILPLIFFITYNSIRTKEWVWRTVFVMCGTMLFINSYLIRQLIWYQNIVSRTKIHATFVYLGPNEIAAFLNQYTVLLLVLYFTMKQSRYKLALLGLLAMNIFSITFLFSRSAYLAFAVGLFLVFVFKKRILLVPLLFAALFWEVTLPDKVIERIEMTTNVYGELDQSSRERIKIWQHSLDLFNENPLTGVGYGVFQYLGFGLGDTHNIYLKIMAEQGVVGIAIFLILLLIFFIQGARLALEGDDEMSRAMGLGFALLIIVLMINNVFGNRWTYLEVSTFLWVFAGLVSRLLLIAREEGETEKLMVKPKKRKKVKKGIDAVKNANGLYDNM